MQKSLSATTASVQQTSFRGPNVVEAEEADKVAMEEIFSLCFSGHGTVAPVGALGDHS